MPTEFTLPELGENIETGDVMRVLVSPGDTLTKDQPVLELETDKATIEVPSSVEGKVTEVSVKAGDKVKVGQVILTVDSEKAQAAAPAKRGSKRAEPAKPAPAEEADEAPPDEGRAEASKADALDEEEDADQDQPVAAGPQRQKQRGDGGKSRARADRQSEQEAREELPEEDLPTAEKMAAREDADADGDQPSFQRRGEVVDISRGARQAAEPDAEREIANAAPSVRRLARELGVDINEVTGSGPGNRISYEDIKAYTRSLLTTMNSAAVVKVPATAPGAPPLPDFSKWGEIERTPMRSVRRKTAERVTLAWTTVPHVTQHDRADITALDRLRKQYEPKAEEAGGKLTITAIAVKVVAAALKVFPQFNSSVDMSRDEIIYKKYIHIGIAVDTDRGLLVPVIRNADTKNILALSVELSELAARAKGRKTTIEEMSGSSFTITNLGGIGGTYFSPILNWPEVAILGLSRAATEPVFVDGQFAPRLVMPLSLSYDHRVIDGADAARFLRWIVEALEQPFLVSFQG